MGGKNITDIYVTGFNPPPPSENGKRKLDFLTDRPTERISKT